MMFAILILMSFCQAALSLMQPTLANLNANVGIDYDVFSFSNVADVKLSWFSQTGKYNSTGRDYSAFVGQFHPSKFSFYPSAKNGCTELIKPSVSSYSTYKCEYATNGGFFTWDTTKPSLCIGNLISDGYIWQLPTDGSGSKRANFGITQENEVVIGFIGEAPTTLFNFTTLMTGWGWLVRKGQSNVAVSADIVGSTSFVTVKAPRTAVGMFKNGTMVLVEIDGNH